MNCKLMQIVVLLYIIEQINLTKTGLLSVMLKILPENESLLPRFIRQHGLSGITFDPLGNRVIHVPLYILNIHTFYLPLHYRPRR